ncbi:MAG: hypothetical protein ACRD0S_02365 [Acidimicrobiales bacterium]
MRRSRWGEAAVLGGVLFMGAVVPAVTATAPASANHAPGVMLQVTPEVASVDVGQPVTFTARLFTTLLGRQPFPGLGNLQVNFDFEGGPLTSEPNRACTIEALESTCTISVQATTSGSTLITAWIDGHPADAEGRLANTLPASDAAADCITAQEGQTDESTCRTGDVTSPGTAAEPDVTDVVRVTWRDRGVDVQPDNQNKALGETAGLTAFVYDLAGNTVTGVEVKWELFDGSISDPGGGTTPATPDRRCTTGTSGSCTINVTQSSNGADYLCAWTSEAPPTVSGKVTDTPICNGEVLLDLTNNDGKPAPADDNQDVARIIWGSGLTPPTTPVTTAPPGGTPAVGNGYWLVASDGGIFAFGEAVFRGSTGAIKLNQPIVGMAATPSRAGYWLVASDGGVFAFGDAPFRGSTGAIKLNQPIVGIAPTPAGTGYWMVAKDGGIFAFGGAVFRGSTGAIKLNQPIVGMAATPTGGGYYLVAADGGVFAFGDAVFRGSTGGIRLAKPIVGMAATPTGNGYYLVAEDGGIFAFGDAVFRGSTGGIRLNQPVVGMSRTLSGGGYRLVARDGGVFAFGDAVFRGSTGAIRLNQPMVGMSGF